MLGTIGFVLMVVSMTMMIITGLLPSVLKTR